MRRSTPATGTASAFLTTSILLLSSSPFFASAASSSKRGLVHVPSANNPTDDGTWTAPGTDLTWYYNYGSTPSPSLAASDLEFVPMLWGAPSSFSRRSASPAGGGRDSSSSSDTSPTPFHATVKAQLDAGARITHALGFNEPDGDHATGGSGIAPATAAEIWKSEIEPLAALGVKLGAPAVTGSPRGFTWLASFFEACAGGCTVDFLPLHYYGPFEGLAAHVGQALGTYERNVSTGSVWITEFALAHEPLDATQEYFNETLKWLDDEMPKVGRYSWFGGFRSDVSNVGPNAAMLDADGELTDLGSWYLGGVATGNLPSAAALGKGSVWGRAGAAVGAAVVAVAAAGFLF